MAQVDVTAEILHWAIQRSGHQAAIEEKFPNLSDWYAGKSHPTLRQLEKFAKATSTPLGYFFLDEPPKVVLDIPLFRTVNERASRPSSPELLDTVHMMERRQAWMREYLIAQDEEPLPFVRSAKTVDATEDVAEKIRDALELRIGWAYHLKNWSEALAELRKRAEASRILVASNGIVGNNTRRRLDPDEFRGFVLVDDYAPLVFINASDFKTAQMFTLAHELAHIWFGVSAAFDLRDLEPASDAAEQACNRVAAEFLVPQAEIQRLWPELRVNPDPFESAAQRFKVSKIVAARRALDLALITKSEFRTFYQNYLNAERKKAGTKEEGGNFYATQGVRLGKRFSEAIIRATAEGSLSYYEAYQLTALYGKTFEEYAHRVGMGTPP